MFKVGKTERSIQERMAELTADTSNIGAYAAMAVFVVSNVDAAEAACHQRLKRYRVQPNREFFELEFGRLVQAVKEETSRYSAVDLVPETSLEALVAKPKRSVSERINDAKEKSAKAKNQFEEDLKEAHANLKRGFELIHERAKKFKDELVDLDHLKWTIESTFEEWHEKKPGRDSPIASVMFCSAFSGDPPVLNASDLRGGIYGEPDLSRAIGEPKSRVTHSNPGKDWEIISWKEIDDGRYGRIKIGGTVYGFQDSGRVHLDFVVAATSIKYDDYDERWKEHDRSKEFSNPEEALDVFEALIVENAVQKPVDIRTMGEWKKKRYGNGFRKIHDNGYKYFNYEKLNE